MTAARPNQKWHWTSQATDGCSGLSASSRVSRRLNLAFGPGALAGLSFGTFPLRKL
jgi:hypothetical protein